MLTVQSPFLKLIKGPPVVANIGLFCVYQVDEQMRQELAEWKLAVDKDKGGKAKGNAKVRPTGQTNTTQYVV